MSTKPASALPNAQKQNSSVFANGIFNNTQRAGELALQQTPTLNPAVPAQLEQINRAGNTSAGPTYLAATQRSNNVIGELVALLVDKGAEALGITIPAANLQANVLRVLSTNDNTNRVDNFVNVIGHSRGTMTSSGALNDLAPRKRIPC